MEEWEKYLQVTILVLRLATLQAGCSRSVWFLRLLRQQAFFGTKVKASKNEDVECYWQGRMIGDLFKEVCQKGCCSTSTVSCKFGAGILQQPQQQDHVFVLIHETLGKLCSGNPPITISRKSNLITIILIVRYTTLLGSLSIYAWGGESRLAFDRTVLLDEQSSVIRLSRPWADHKEQKKRIYWPPEAPCIREKLEKKVLTLLILCI